MEKKQYESLKEKLRKLQALVERGYKGESENARLAIERICSQYGLKIEEILDVETKHTYTFEIGRQRNMMNLFVRCLSLVCDTDNMKYRKPTRSSICIKLTAFEYAEVSNLFNWHKDNFNRELEDFKDSFMSAYIGKHNLFFDSERSGGGDDNERRLTQEQIKKIRQILKMQEVMNDNTYHKQLEDMK